MARPFAQRDTALAWPAGVEAGEVVEKFMRSSITRVGKNAQALAFFLIAQITESRFDRAAPGSGGTRLRRCVSHRTIGPVGSGGGVGQAAALQ